MTPDGACGRGNMRQLLLSHGGPEGLCLELAVVGQPGVPLAQKRMCKTYRTQSLGFGGHLRAVLEAASGEGFTPVETSLGLWQCSGPSSVSS